MNYFFRDIALLLELVPLRDLLSGTVHDLVPVMGFRSAMLGADFQTAYDLVLGHAIPIQSQELQTDVLETLVTRNIEQERFIEDRVECALLYVSLLLSDPLPVVKQVHLYIGICKSKRQTCHVCRVTVCLLYAEITVIAINAPRSTATAIIAN